MSLDGNTISSSVSDSPAMVRAATRRAFRVDVCDEHQFISDGLHGATRQVPQRAPEIARPVSSATSGHGSAAQSRAERCFARVP
jgi:hypothetical protein